MSSYWKNHIFVLGALKAFSFFVFSLIVNYYAVRYATVNAGPAVPDILLDTIPMIDTRFIDYYVPFYLQYVFFIFAVLQPKFLIFFLKSGALLILVRAMFVNLTNLGIPEGTIPTMSFFTQGGDLFFSGHTAMPFLAALVFWHMRPMRYICLFLALFMGIEVLIGHQHYTIDVVAAPFITYGVFAISKKLFKKD